MSRVRVCSAYVPEHNNCCSCAGTQAHTHAHTHAHLRQLIHTRACARRARSDECRVSAVSPPQSHCLPPERTTLPLWSATGRPPAGDKRARGCHPNSREKCHVCARSQSNAKVHASERAPRTTNRIAFSAAKSQKLSQRYRWKGKTETLGSATFTIKAPGILVCRSNFFVINRKRQVIFV